MKSKAWNSNHEQRMACKKFAFVNVERGRRVEEIDSLRECLERCGKGAILSFADIESIVGISLPFPPVIIAHGG